MDNSTLGYFSIKFQSWQWPPAPDRPAGASEAAVSLEGPGFYSLLIETTATGLELNYAGKLLFS